MISDKEILEATQLFHAPIHLFGKVVSSSNHRTLLKCATAPSGYWNHIIEIVRKEILNSRNNSLIVSYISELRFLDEKWTYYVIYINDLQLFLPRH